MVAPIPVGQSHRVTLSGSIWRPITCQKCACQFAYLAKFEASGEEVAVLWIGGDRAKHLAQEKAQKQLPESKRKASGFYPCPKCGHVQSEMLYAQRLKAAREAGLILLASFMAGGITSSITRSDDLGVVVGVITGVSLVVSRFREMSAILTRPADWHPAKPFSETYPVLLRLEYESLARSADAERISLTPLIWPELRKVP